MLAVTDTTLHLLVLQLVLHGLGVGIGGLVLGILAPVHAWSEDDVLANGGGIVGRSWGVLGALAELGPGFPVSDSRVHGLGVGDVSDAASGLDLLAIVIVSISNDRLGSILVGDSLGGREFGGRRLLDVVVVGPIVPV
jgi:hypothetical protein